MDCPAAQERDRQAGQGRHIEYRLKERKWLQKKFMQENCINKQLHVCDLGTKETPRQDSKMASNLLMN